jgi:hypothetical protein
MAEKGFADCGLLLRQRCGVRPDPGCVIETCLLYDVPQECAKGGALPAGSLTAHFPSSADAFRFCTKGTAQRFRAVYDCDGIILSFVAGTDVMACESFGGVERDSCFAVFATERADPVLCRKAVQADIKENCLSVVAGLTMDESLCKEIRDRTRRSTCAYRAGAI